MRKHPLAVIAVLGSVMYGPSEASAGCRCPEYSHYGPSAYGYYAPTDYYALPPYYLAPTPYGYHRPAPYPYYAPRSVYGYAIRPLYFDRYYGYAGWQRW